MGLSQDTTWAYHYPRVVREDPAVRKPLKSRLASLVSAFVTVLVTCLLSIWMQSDCLCLGACAVNVHREGRIHDKIGEEHGRKIGLGRIFSCKIALPADLNCWDKLGDVQKLRCRRLKIGLEADFFD